MRLRRNKVNGQHNSTTPEGEVFRENQLPQVGLEPVTLGAVHEYSHYIIALPTELLR